MRLAGSAAVVMMLSWAVANFHGRGNDASHHEAAACCLTLPHHRPSIEVEADATRWPLHHFNHFGLSNRLIDPMRALILLIIGIVIGAFCGMTATRQLLAARAYPRGVMAVMQQHLVAAKSQLARGSSCDVENLRQPLLRIEQFAPEVQAALLPTAGGSDANIVRLSNALLQTSTAAVKAPVGTDCKLLAAPLHAIEQACVDCHREYR